MEGASLFEAGLRVIYAYLRSSFRDAARDALAT
jgi:hypothetical protein